TATALTTARRSVSIPRTRDAFPTEATRMRTKATPTGRLLTTARRSGSIQRSSLPLTTAALRIGGKVITTERLLTTPRRFGSILHSAMPLATEGLRMGARANTTAPWLTSVRQSGSIPKVPQFFLQPGRAKQLKGDRGGGIADINRAKQLGHSSLSMMRWAAWPHRSQVSRRG